MQEKNMRYGQFLRAKRISDNRELTLKDVAEELGVSVSFVSDVEQGRRKPYDEAKTQKTIADQTLAALTIMVAESRPEEKEMMINVIMNCMV